jgi:hypothetical protein
VVPLAVVRHGKVIKVMCTGVMLPELKPGAHSKVCSSGRKCSTSGYADLMIRPRACIFDTLVATGSTPTSQPEDVEGQLLLGCCCRPLGLMCRTYEPPCTLTPALTLLVHPPPVPVAVHACSTGGSFMPTRLCRRKHTPSSWTLFVMLPVAESRATKP